MGASQEWLRIPYSFCVRLEWRKKGSSGGPHRQRFFELRKKPMIVVGFILLFCNNANQLAGNVVSLETFGDPHIAAVLLKKYLRDLPEPIFPETLYPTIRRCPIPSSDPADMTAISFVRETLLPELPPCAYILLSHVLRE